STPEQNRPVFVTTPIFYVNAAPHIGHLYSTVLTDSLKRWYEFKGHQTVFCTGTDEHGLKIQQAAAEAKTSPQEFCDGISSKFRDLFGSMNISYTDYIRTTEPRHYEAVSVFWARRSEHHKKLLDRGYIYKGYHEGWYCVSDECFYPQAQVEVRITQAGERKMVSKESGRPVVWFKEENYKFKLSAFREPLIKWLTENPEAVIPANQYSQVLHDLTADAANSLMDISVSRLKSRLEWGIPVPNDPDHVMYVWLDALVNYLTVTGYPWDTPAKAVLKNAWPAHVHVVGKDIVKFHAIYWPAFLMAADLPLPRQVLSHGHWLMGNQKMSKSVGNIVDPQALVERFGVDPIRYFLMRNGGIGSDSEFSMEMVEMWLRKDLNDALGNLVMRCTAPRI
ncbi:Methionyl/Leucyl tRNA synthetase, partial [Blyttiomyces helicus]